MLTRNVMIALIIAVTGAFSPLVSFACNYTLTLSDSYGDGWNGASLTVYANGSSVGSYTINSGSSSTYTVTFAAGANISLNFSGGTYPDECSWILYDENGGIACSGSGGNTTNPVCSFTTNGCDFIPPPPTTEDCLGAIPICQNYYSHPGSVTFGDGNYQNEINIPFEDCVPQEFGGVWYSFTPQTPGQLSFVIDPVDDMEDYDWALFDITGASCANLGINPMSYLVSANTAGNDGSYPPVNHGPTGMQTNLAASSSNCVGPGTGSFNTYNNNVTVTTGHQYVLYIAQFDGSNGYSINFANSTTSIFDTIPPVFESVDGPLDCGETSLTFHFNENIMCSTVSDADFYVTGPGGPYTLSGATSPVCASGGDYDMVFTASVSPPLTTSGTYTIGLDASAAGSLTDFCGNQAPSTSFDFTVSCLSITESQTNASCAGICDGTATVTPVNGVAPINYVWSPAVTATGSATNLCAGTYNVTVTDASGNAAATIFTITEPPAISIDSYSSTPEDCGLLNGSITVAASGGNGTLTYSGNQLTSNTTGIFSNVAAGNYTITITDQNSCSVTQAVTVDPIGSVTSGFTASPDQCLDANLFAFTNTGETGAGITWTWNFENGFPASSTQENPSNVSWNAAGVYTVTQTTWRGGCNSVSTAEIEVFAKPVVSITPATQTICPGGTASFTAVVSSGSSPFDYFWGHTSDNQATVTDNPDTPTDYSLYVVDNNGCASLTATASVTLSSGISLNVTASPMEICLGESSILSFSIFGGVNPVVYMVDGNPASSPQSVSPLETTTYSVSATDACGSVASQDITIGVFDVPQFSFTASSTEGCSPLSVQFSGDNLIDFQSVHWNFGDGDSDYQSSLPYPVHLYEIGGVFDVSLTVQTALGCVGTITIPDMITVYNNPIAQFDADPNTITNISSQVDFFNESLLATSYLWDFGDEETSVDENPFHEYYDPAPGTITVTLVAYSNQNCTDTARVTLKVKGEYTLFMPNSFTPDGDGINDKFAVKGSGISNDGFKMTIYNRWGEVIYYSTDLDAGWNGRLSNGEKAEQGTYTWQVSFYEIWGKGHLEIGKVTLIR